VVPMIYSRDPRGQDAFNVVIKKNAISACVFKYKEVRMDITITRELTNG